MKKLIVLFAMLLLVAGSSFAQWCVTCYCSGGCGNAAKKEAFCGSFDATSPQGCWSYFIKPQACPYDPNNPGAVYGTYRTEWRLGFTCISGDDCF